MKLPDGMAWLENLYSLMGVSCWCTEVVVLRAFPVSVVGMDFVGHLLPRSPGI